jgi:hypothetical protein
MKPKRPMKFDTAMRAEFLWANKNSSERDRKSAIIFLAFSGPFEGTAEWQSQNGR